MRIGDLFVLSCANILRVFLSSVCSDVFICGGCVCRRVFGVLFRRYSSVMAVCMFFMFCFIVFGVVLCGSVAMLCV